MFCQKNTENNFKDLHCLQYGDNSQFSQTLMDSSQNSQHDLHSQSFQRMNMGEGSSDYWSQSSSQQQEEVLRSYPNKPLLFGSRNGNLLLQKKQVNRSNSYGQFIDMQQKKQLDSQQRFAVENFVSLLKEYSAEVKSTLESVKSKFELDMEKNSEIIKSSVESSEKILEKVQGDISATLENTKMEFESSMTLTDEINQKNAELKVRDEQIAQLHHQVLNLQKTIELFTEKENQYYEGQQELLKQILKEVSRNDEVTQNQLKITHKVESLIKQNVEMKTSLENINISQGTCFQSIYEMHKKISRDSDCLTQNQQSNHTVAQQNNYIAHPEPSLMNHGPPSNYQLNNLVHSYPYAFQQQQIIGVCPMSTNQQLQAKSLTTGRSQKVILPTRPLSHFSPLPLNTRRFDTTGNPSPTAVVAPMVQNKFVKQEATGSAYRELPSDILELSSDSDSGQDLADIVKQHVLKQGSNVKVTSGKTKKTKLPTPNQTIKTSTPLQRSIRRYGKIKKRVLPFSPLTKVPPKSSTRECLVMKRKQENAFNFDGADDDLFHLTELLKRR